MTKAELVNQIAMETGYDKATILGIVEATMACIKKDVAAGENVYLRGFGSFVSKTRAEKVARNITAKTSILVPEHKIPAFKPAREFAAQVRK
jgi:DNA-binding protein HU-beta